jgi:hypothetical protein
MDFMEPKNTPKFNTKIQILIRIVRDKILARVCRFSDPEIESP